MSGSSSASPTQPRKPSLQVAAGAPHAAGAARPAPAVELAVAQRQAADHRTSADFAVGGVTRFTTTDYPGKLAAVVFAQGCPWRCSYCHNPHLLPSRRAAGQAPPESGWSEFLQWLETRRGLLDAVVFSGGEPTAQSELVKAVGAVRALGFAVGLHTGGAYPRRLVRLLPQLDWVGLDIKTTRAGYPGITGAARSGVAAFAALDDLCRSGVDFEVRTTVHPTLTPPGRLETLARDLARRGILRWVLQRFRPIGCASAALIATSPDLAVLDDGLLARLGAHIPDIVIR